MSPAPEAQIFPSGPPPMTIREQLLLLVTWPEEKERRPGSVPYARLSGTFRCSDGERRYMSFVFPHPLSEEGQERVAQGQYMNIPIRLENPVSGEWEFYHFPYDPTLDTTFAASNQSRSLMEALDEMDRPMLLETFVALAMLIAFFGIWLWLLFLGSQF